MKVTTWTAIVAGLGLVISIFNLWYGVLRARLKERLATPSVQLDLLRVRLKSGEENEVRLVVLNQGPATMSEVDAQVFDADGKSLEIDTPDLTALWPKMPVAELRSGQYLFLTLNRSLATRDAKQALIRWKDGRRDQQTCMVPLSYNRTS